MLVTLNVMNMAVGARRAGRSILQTDTSPGEGGVTPQTSCQFISGPHQKLHTRTHTYLPHTLVFALQERTHADAGRGCRSQACICDCEVTAPPRGLFTPPPFSSEEERRLNSLWPGRAPQVY